MFNDLKISDWWFLGIAALVGYAVVKHFLSKLSSDSSANKPDAQPDAEPTGRANTEKEESQRNENSAKREVPRRKTESNTPLEWYQVLEVGASASLEEIKQAYKRKIRLYHPDRVAGLGPEFMAIAEAKAKEINTAYQLACAVRRGV